MIRSKLRKMTSFAAATAATNSDSSCCDQVLNGVRIMAIDIGGHLLKIAFLKHYETIKMFKLNEQKIDQFLSELNAIAIPDSKQYKYKNFELYFYLFDREAATVDKVFEIIQAYSSHIFCATYHRITLNGSGSSSMKKRLLSFLEKRIESIETVALEFKVSYAGVNVLRQLNKQSHREWYTYSKKGTNGEDHFGEYSKCYVEVVDTNYILVYIGTATSFLYVTASKILYLQYSNISGGTYLGLCKLLCGFKSFNEALKASELGENRHIDFTMLDMVQGKSFCETGAATADKSTGTGNEDGSDIEFIINSFGKLAIAADSGATSGSVEKYKRDDIANALLLMVINSFTLSACHFAKKLNSKQIVFAGSFLLNNNYGKYRIAKLVRYLTNDAVKAIFSSKDAFINAIGCLNDKHDVKIESFM